MASLSTFVELHSSQLLSVGFPRPLWSTLHSKVCPHELMDLEEFVELHEDETTHAQTLHLKRGKRVSKNSDVFLIEHIWTSDGYRQAKQNLLDDSQLLVRLERILILMRNFQHCVSVNDFDFVNHQTTTVMKVANVSSKEAKRLLNSTHYELIPSVMTSSEDGLTSEVLSQHPEPVTFEEFKAGLKGSLEDQLDDEEHMKTLHKQFTRDRKTAGVGGRGESRHYSWVENREDNSLTVVVKVPHGCHKKDISSTMTNKTWEFGLCGHVPVINGEFHRPIVSLESFWMIESSGSVHVTIQKSGSDDEPWPELLKGEEHLDSKKQAEREKLEEQCGITERIEKVLKAMWQYNQTYQALTKEGLQLPMWYLMDEAGCALAHSSSPNSRCVPFACSTTGKFYSILWPIEDLRSGDMLTRDFCPLLNAHCQETLLQRKARELACQRKLTCPDEFVHALSVSRQVSDKISSSHQFINASLSQSQTTPLSAVLLDSQQQLKLFVDMKWESVDWVSAGISLVTDVSQSDIIWITDSSSVDVTQLKPTQCITRLTGDECLIHKEKLFKTLRLAGLSNVDWLPVTYDLMHQLPELIADHESRGIFNWWIVKRSVSSLPSFQFPLVTSDVRRIIRLIETGPCVASHFHLSSALFDGKRLALCYSVVVLSTNPLKLLVHVVPSVRLCTRDAGDLYDYDHYDCSSLLTDSVSVDVKWDDVMSDFDKHLRRREQGWKHIEMRIYQLIADVFAAASHHLTAHSVCRSRGVYGVNIMLLSSFQPLLLSVDSVPAIKSLQVLSDIVSVLGQPELADQTLDHFDNFLYLR